MTDIQRKVKVLMLINLILLVSMALFCFQNSDLNFEGICEECLVFTPIVFRVGAITIMIQLLVVVIMWHIFKSSQKEERFGRLKVLAVVGILLALFQCRLFLLPMDVNGHGAFDERAQLIVKMMDVQYVVAKVISVGVIILNIILIRILHCGEQKERIY